MSQIQAAKKVSIEVEHDRQGLQCALTSAEIKIQSLESYLEEYKQEQESLAVRLRLEQNRVKELDQLLVAVRLQEHKMELSNQNADNRNAKMQDMVSCLQKKIVGLEHQIQTLEMTRDAQNIELARLESKLSAQVFKNAAICEGREEHNALFEKEREEKVRALERDLENSRREANDKASKLHEMEARLASLDEDNKRMLNLLSKIDTHRMQLEQQNKKLMSERRGGSFDDVGDSRRRDSRSSDASSPAVFEESHSLVKALKKECAKLKGDLAVNEGQRRVLQQDFESLAETLREVSSGQGKRGSSEGNLEAQLARLMVENEKLRENVVAMETRCEQRE
ncbi:hypothetical protein CBR_g23504 [Chara braunii]|uniref:Uncharacterized protein n=1 Tax=Chara braunii TaxID=69332 RepID=A0A388L4K7_CHABU|nr:hypothetical protein CBR_g23504 [Chara braunii]|eukprot:GBG77178.1 hypothetical protein CBR_g23504 [Chara braunii]